MGQRFGGDHDRGCGIGDQFAEAGEFCVVEQMRVVDDDGHRVVALLGRPRQDRDLGPA